MQFGQSLVSPIEVLLPFKNILKKREACTDVLFSVQFSDYGTATANKVSYMYALPKDKPTISFCSIPS